ncbi:NAD(P)-dependent oxidoreductase [Notoacmeibacter sp. MSK16QG-6]|uniref:NAD(P)-dependent oxidoreductase n=1 Tax=Notoacmeibacter sp. MSK16QG-6 TaxID=2957982 RepID=UPI0020A035AB|nr:NAD(P)-dependent oxidoreductase [Notoacmeibacter sp. MSK16QG-6]MCP1199547.1 DUF1932 domain-containing protein [Notoacmeibacter sp. MSK16QG-6]
MIYAIPLAGEMGAGIGAALVRSGNTVLTCVEGRSQATRLRAVDAGMQDASFTDLARADIILSIVPPSLALDMAKNIAQAMPDGAAPLYVDLNAVNPQTVRQIEAALPDSVRFADGSIIGAAPKTSDAKIPRFYVSGPAAGEALALRDHGLDIEPLDGGTGAASALKMCYGALTKGNAALTAAILMAAEREGVGAALHAEMEDSQRARLTAAENFIPSVYAKAYRWVAEMEHIAAFLGENRAEAGIWASAATFYQHMADDYEGDRAEIDAIDRFLARDDKLRR